MGLAVVVGRKHSLCQQLGDHEPESQAGMEVQALGFTSSLAHRREQLWAPLCLLSSLPCVLDRHHSLQGPAPGSPAGSQCLLWGHPAAVEFGG